MPPDLGRIDPVLMSQVRLGVVTALFGGGAMTFPELKVVLGVTQGNLGDHLDKLEEAGYVTVEKEFVARKPRTTVRLSERGRDAFERHVRYLTSFLG